VTPSLAEIVFDRSSANRVTGLILRRVHLHLPVLLVDARGAFADGVLDWVERERTVGLRADIDVVEGDHIGVRAVLPGLARAIALQMLVRTIDPRPGRRRRVIVGELRRGGEDDDDAWLDGLGR
jgi:hypothetical protein